MNQIAELDNAGAVTGRMSYGAAGLTGYNTVQFQFNPLGDVAHSLNAAGAVQTQRLYDAYGNPLQSPVTSDPFGYRGQVGYYTDHEAGYIALAYRFYDPGTGRFLNRDPIGFRGGVNLYGYVGGGVTAFVDSRGTQGTGQVPAERRDGPVISDGSYDLGVDTVSQIGTPGMPSAGGILRGARYQGGRVRGALDEAYRLTDPDANQDDWAYQAPPEDDQQTGPEDGAGDNGSSGWKEAIIGTAVFLGCLVLNKVRGR